MATKVVTDDTFEADVLKADRPVIVDFWAPWCGPSEQIAPVIDELGEVYDTRVHVVKVNTDENPAVAQHFGIVGLPTVAVFDGGEQVLAISGAKPAREYLAILEPWID